MKALLTTSVAVVAILTTAMLVGCLSAGKTVVGAPPKCPLCQMSTSSAPAAGQTYKEEICPMCSARTVGQWQYERGYDPSPVYYCQHCGVRVGTCPMCAKKNK